MNGTDEIDIEMIFNRVAEKRKSTFTFDNTPLGSPDAPFASYFKDDNTLPHLSSNKSSKTSECRFEEEEQTNHRVEITNYKLHDFWLGNNKFCFDGRCIFGIKNTSNQKKGCLFGVLIIFTIYVTIPAFHIYERISPVLTLVTIYMFVLTVFFYAMTTT